MKNRIVIKDTDETRKSIILYVYCFQHITIQFDSIRLFGLVFLFTADHLDSKVKDQIKQTNAIKLSSNMLKIFASILPNTTH